MSTTTATSQQVSVPETLLKKRRQNDKTREEKLAAAAESKKKRQTQRKVIFKRAEQYVKEYVAKEKDEVRLKREARKSGDFYVEAEPKVLVVVRIKGISKLPPKKRSILRLLRLLKINAMTFVRATKATLQMLRLVEDCITFGEPNLKTVKELLYKRGFAKVSGQRIPIQDNAIIEQNLGKHGLVCIEDLVHEIYTCGPHFKQASQFLWPFQLSNPNGGWAPRKFKGFVEGGDAGNRGDSINSLIHSMC